jgi:diaminopimelate decarboxylase
MSGSNGLSEFKKSSKLLDHDAYCSLAAIHGPSFFLLDAEQLRSNYASFRSAFTTHYPKVEIGYSYKTNYTPQICRILQDAGAWAEVVSEMEYAAALRLDTPCERIIFNGPYKAEWAFSEAALGGATLNLDSRRDLDLLSAVAVSAPAGIKIRVVLRTNFVIDANVSRFGFDVEGAEFASALETINALPNVYLAGLHCHFPNRDLDSFRKRAEGLVGLCKRIFRNQPPEVLNIGGGYFSVLPECLRRTLAEPPATFNDYGRVIGQLLSQAFPDKATAPTLFLEPGTALVADVMTFYTQVVSTKSVRDRHFATVAGSIFDISPNAKIKILPVTPIFDPKVPREPARDFAVAGFTCIESDLLTDSLIAPLEVGDVLAYGNVGSYSIVMRPSFILPANPILMMRENGEGFDIIKARQSNDAVFDLFKEIGT